MEAGDVYGAWVCRLVAALITHCRDPLLLIVLDLVKLKV
jgi:hypothetical protein